MYQIPDFTAQGVHVNGDGEGILNSVVRSYKCSVKWNTPVKAKREVVQDKCGAVLRLLSVKINKQQQTNKTLKKTISS